MGEFDLIDRFFKRKASAAPAGRAQGAIEEVVLGIGDDCALLQPAGGQQMAISTDLMVEGRHFLPGAEPHALGHKALAVNLSDLAAMGAEPLAFTLALSLPLERAADSTWLDAFSDGMLALAGMHRCALVGGDTTGGPLTVCITVFGQVPAGQALRRSGARPGDDLWVSGTLGDARIVLGALRGEWSLPARVLAAARERLDRPTPRVALGLALRGIASGCIDLSDGLSGDLGHVLAASGVAAWLDADALPSLIDPGLTAGPDVRAWTRETRIATVLTGGDDYELLFTAPPGRRADVETAARRAQTRVTRIGAIEPGAGLWLQSASGVREPVRATSFDHFASQGAA